MNRHAFASRALARFARGLLFLQYILGLFVLAQTEVGWMAHFTGAGPLGEFHLGHQLRLDPCGGGLALDRLHERRTRCPERPKPLMELAQGRVRETGAHVTDIAPALTAPHREYQ